MENLSRLASKPGVQSTLVLSKSDGSIISSTGLLANSPQRSSKDETISTVPDTNGMELPSASSRVDGDFGSNTDITAKNRYAEDIARKVFAFVEGAKSFTEGMDKSDEVKLLRLRTRKNEIVIVPGR